MTPSVSPRTVVGVDGSPESADALRWAIDYAEAVGGDVRVVHAWEPPVVASLGLPPLSFDWEPLAEHAKAIPVELVRQTLGDDPGARVFSVAVRGGAAHVLVQESKKADLLVIGSRGLGGLKGMILGSVGHHCAAHAECPVVIVHHRKQRPTVRRSLPG